MVIPRSRSRSIESNTWEAISRSVSPPQIWMKRSARVDLPWSMWAIIEKLRIRLRSLTAGFFQTWFARHGGDRGLPRKQPASLPDYAPSRYPHRRRSQLTHCDLPAGTTGLFGQTECDVACPTLAYHPHGNRAIYWKTAGNLGEVRNRLNCTVVEVGDNVTGAQSDHRAGSRAHLTYYH